VQQTRREIVEELLDFMGEAGDSDAEVSAVLVLNRIIQTIWLKHPWSDHLMPNPVEIATVANQRTYVLPDHFGRVRPNAAMRNLTSGGMPMEPIAADAAEVEFPMAGTSLETPGLPQRFDLAGTVGIAVQPSSSGEALEVVSSSAADTAVKVTVEGPNAQGVWTRTTVTLTGTVAVAVGTFRNDVINFSKAYADGTDPATPGTSSVGSVTLRKVVGGTVLETLQPEESAHERRTVVIYPVPDAVYTLALPFMRAPRRLIADSDEVPRFWGPAIIEEARLEWTLNGGDLDIVSFTNAKRPRLTELIEHDNSLRYAGWRATHFSG
jgi:hypothetical protein